MHKIHYNINKIKNNNINNKINNNTINKIKNKIVINNKVNKFGTIIKDHRRIKILVYLRHFKNLNL
jgi:hypothetical protein